MNPGLYIKKIIAAPINKKTTKKTTPRVICTFLFLSSFGLCNPLIRFTAPKIRKTTTPPRTKKIKNKINRYISILI